MHISIFETHLTRTWAIFITNLSHELDSYGSCIFYELASTHRTWCCTVPQTLTWVTRVMNLSHSCHELDAVHQTSSRAAWPLYSHLSYLCHVWHELNVILLYTRPAQLQPGHSTLTKVICVMFDTNSMLYCTSDQLNCSLATGALTHYVFNLIHPLFTCTWLKKKMRGEKESHINHARAESLSKYKFSTFLTPSFFIFWWDRNERQRNKRCFPWLMYVYCMTLSTPSWPVCVTWLIVWRDSLVHVTCLVRVRDVTWFVMCWMGSFYIALITRMGYRVYGSGTWRDSRDVTWVTTCWMVPPCISLVTRMGYSV